MSSRRSVGLLAAAAGWLLAAGCGGDAGVLVEVTRDDSVPSDIGRLGFHVGIDGIPGYPSRFVDPDPEADVRLDGRDILADPYRLFIRPREHADARLMVAVVAYRGEDVVGFGAFDRPVRFVDGQVSMWRILLEGRLPDGFGTSDLGCLTWVNDSGQQVTVGQGSDQDCDGWMSGDCNDLDPAVNPGAGEICANGRDEDCDGATDENVDEDGDRVTTCDGDCNDADLDVHPGAVEECDGADNDCNGLCDEGLDGDGDTFTVCGSKTVDSGAACLFGRDLADCDDSAAESHPGAEEVCDGKDNDCNRICDDGDAGLDRDGDRFTPCGSLTGQCARSDLVIDCEDEDDAVHPGAIELCNGIDDNCDGERLQRGACFAVDLGGGGDCYFGERDCAEQRGEAGDWEGDCRPLVAPDNLSPTAVCTSYTTCDAADDPDPYACAIESDASGLALTRCAVSTSIATGAQCPGSAVVLPSGGLADCSWAVVGGVDQGDYRVGLRAVGLPDDTPQPDLDVCGAVLVVFPARKGVPAPRHVLLARTDSLAETVYFALSLDPRPVDRCAPPAGLACEGLPER